MNKRCGGVKEFKCERILPMTEEHFARRKNKRAKTEKGKWSSACKDCSRQYAKKYYTPERTRAYNLRAAFGTTPEEYRRLLDLQQGLCRICGREETPLRNKEHTLHVDHCHASGKIRGLLCRKCNTSLGIIEMMLSSGTLSSAIKYLTRLSPRLACWYD